MVIYTPTHSHTQPPTQTHTQAHSHTHNTHDTHTHARTHTTQTHIHTEVIYSPCMMDPTKEILVPGLKMQNLVKWLSTSKPAKGYYHKGFLAIGQFHVSENILINCLIALTSLLDALDACKNVLQPMGIRRPTGIKQLCNERNIRQR